jgi:DNA-binding beta-propeller fold protein YncE
MTVRVDVGAEPRFTAFAFESVWVSNYGADTITRIDPATGSVLAEVETADGPQIMTLAADSLWVSSTDADVVQRIDQSTNEVVATIPTPFAPDGLAFDGTFILWVATEAGPQLAGIEISSEPLGVNEPLGVWDVADEGAINANQVMVFDGNALWLPILARGVVLRIPPPVTIVE